MEAEDLRASRLQRRSPALVSEPLPFLVLVHFELDSGKNSQTLFYSQRESDSFSGKQETVEMEWREGWMTGWMEGGMNGWREG